MSEETVSIPKQKIVELVNLLDEAKQILRGAPTPPKVSNPKTQQEQAKRQRQRCWKG